MSISTLIIVLLILFLVGALPAWNPNATYGYGPSGIAGAIVVVLIVLLLLGRI